MEGTAAESWLGTLLALAGVSIAAREGLANHQALSWAVLCLLLALPLVAPMLRARPLRNQPAPPSGG